MGKRTNGRKLNEGFPPRIETAKNAERERSRVKSLRDGFQKLQTSLPSVPRDTKLSKLDVLILAMNHINHLTKILETSENVEAQPPSTKLFHPVKKWPMRSRLYAGNETIQVRTGSVATNENQNGTAPANEADATSQVVSSINGDNDVAIQEMSDNFNVSGFNNWESFFDVTIDNSLVSMSSETSSFNFEDFIN